MSNSVSEKPKKLLIITCSGGGGLLQAAVAKEQEVRGRDPNLKIIRCDTLKDWIWLKLGHLFVWTWNNSQTKGNVAFQSFCVWGQIFVDYVFWPNFFLSALITFFKEEVDEVIDTQNMGTSGIVHALRVYNFRRKKKVQIQKVLVDLPTKKATHFFWPIKTLSKKSRKLIRLITIPPLLEGEETEEEFWHANCRLSSADIHYEDLNVRQAFRKYQGKGRASSPIQIKIRTNHEEELGLMQKCYERGSIRGKVKENGIEFIIQPHDRMITVLLGSQPGNEGTFNYIKKFLQLAKESENLQIPTHLFVFCSKHTPNGTSLFQKTADWIEQLKEYPAYFSVIPFSFQKEDVIAPLFYRSHITCTRSGGQTAMELMCVSNGEIWIHSEAKGEQADLPLEGLLKGIPGWEAANALYLQKARGAKIVTTDTFIPHARRLFRSDDRPARTNRESERPLESTA